MWAWGIGGLLTAFGVGLLFWLLGGAMAPTAGAGAATPSAQFNPLLAIGAGLSLACGVTLLGLAAGHWKSARSSQAMGIARTPDSQRVTSSRHAR